MQDGDIYRLFNVPRTLRCSKNKQLFVITEWNHCIDYLIGVYTDEYGNIQEQAV